MTLPTHEERKRELAKVATQPSWFAVDGGIAIRGYGLERRIICDDVLLATHANLQHIAFNDPETALLEADKMEAGDALDDAAQSVLNIKADSIRGYEETLQARMTELRLAQNRYANARAALDAHAENKRNRNEVK